MPNLWSSGKANGSTEAISCKNLSAVWPWGLSIMITPPVEYKREYRKFSTQLFSRQGFSQAADNVQVLRRATLGIAGLAGRLSVKMTGTFTPGTQFTLLHADGGLNNQKFNSVSISYTSVPTYTPVITYDANNVYLYLRPN